MPLELAKPLREAVAGGIEQQSRSLGAIGGQHHGARRLKMLVLAGVKVVHAGGASLGVDLDVEHIALGAEFRSARWPLLPESWCTAWRTSREPRSRSPCRSRNACNAERPR